MKSPVVKRSIVVAGHKTSVSLEEAFWNGMKEISGLRDMTLSELVGEIDSNRQQGNLSSAIRLFVLDYFRTRAASNAAARKCGRRPEFHPAIDLTQYQADARSARTDRWRGRARGTARTHRMPCARNNPGRPTSVNQSGARRLRERGCQRAILLARRAADPRRSASGDTAPAPGCPARSARARNIARSARGSDRTSGRARTRPARACSRRACGRSSRSDWPRWRSRRDRAPSTARWPAHSRAARRSWHRPSDSRK